MQVLSYYCSAQLNPLLITTWWYGKISVTETLYSVVISGLEVPAVVLMSPCKVPPEVRSHAWQLHFLVVPLFGCSPTILQSSSLAEASVPTLRCFFQKFAINVLL